MRFVLFFTIFGCASHSNSMFSNSVQLEDTIEFHQRIRSIQQRPLLDQLSAYEALRIELGDFEIANTEEQLLLLTEIAMVKGALSDNLQRSDVEIGEDRQGILAKVALSEELISLQKRYEELNINSTEYHVLLRNISTVHAQMNRYSDAKATFVKLLEMQRRTFGASSLVLLPTLDGLIETLLYLGQWDESLTYANDALRILRRNGRKEDVESGQFELLAISAWIELAQYSEALASLERLNRVHQTASATFRAAIAHHLGIVHHKMGHIKQAQEYLQQALDERIRELGDAHLDTASSQNNLAMVFASGGSYQIAEPLFIQSLHTFQRTVGTKHPNTIGVMNNLGLLYLDEGRFVEAKQLFAQILRLEGSDWGLDHPEVIHSANNLANLHLVMGEEREAEELLRKNVEALQRHYGEAHPLVWKARSNLASVWIQQLRPEDAMIVLQEMLLLQTERLGVAHIDTLATQSTLGNLYLSLGQFQEAKVIFDSVLENTNQLYAPEHPQRILAMRNQAFVDLSLGNMQSAKVTYEQILKIQEVSLGRTHPNTLQTLSGIGFVYQNNGLYPEAEVYFSEVLVRQIEAFGETHPVVLKSYTVLASLYERQGRYDLAEPMLYKTVHVARGIYGAQHPTYLNSVVNLAQLYTSQGRYLEANTLLNQTYDAFQRKFGPQHPYTLQTLSKLGQISLDTEQFETAAQQFKTLVEGAEASMGLEHPDTLAAKTLLAQCLINLHQLGEAESVLQEIIALQEVKLGAKHPQTLVSKSALANLYVESDRLEEGKILLEQILVQQSELFGDVHPSTIQTLFNLTKVSMYSSMSDSTTTVQYARRLARAEEKLLRLNEVGSEDSKQQFFATFQASTDLFMKLHFEKGIEDYALQSLAMEAWMSRKGRVLDSQVDMMSKVQNSLDDEGKRLLARRTQLIEQQVDLQEQALEADSKERSERLDKVSQELQEIDLQLSVLSKDFERTAREIDIVSISQALPPDFALIQYVIFTPNSEEPLKQMLAANILHPDGKMKSVQIGWLDSFEEKLKAFRQTRSVVLGRELFIRLLEPLLKGDQLPTHLLISPDGSLNLLPFELLHFSSEQRLADVVQVSYLDSGRDLLGMKGTIKMDLAKKPIVFGNPRFGTESEWKSLKATQGEARLIQGIFSNAQLFLEADATVENLKGLKEASILHIATHGFVEADSSMSIADDNPMFRTGLVFTSEDGRQDSTLRASELATLSLWNTELVVLSACESGLGTSANGEGVYGMRRAFSLAGARSQVVSLWAVSDEATQFFMEHFYTALSKGSTKSEALEAARQKMKSHTRWNNPIFWGAFILIGDWR